MTEPAAADTGSPSGICLVLCTAPADVADNIAGALVSARLAACVNILPAVVSTYRWKGHVARDDEALLMIKTAADRVAQLTLKIREVHPYELPEVLALPVRGGLNDYLAWVVAESRPEA
jgi:periplasmic divalent cation tolerance protein